jgi:hypothetical protein
MKRIYAGSVGYFLIAAPNITNLNESNLKQIADRLKVSVDTLKILIEYKASSN